MEIIKEYDAGYEYDFYPRTEEERLKGGTALREAGYMVGRGADGDLRITINREPSQFKTNIDEARQILINVSDIDYVGRGEL